MLIVITMILQSLISATIIVSATSTLRLLRRLVYNFVLDLGLGTTQINTAAIHIGLFDILNQVLSDVFIQKCYKAKPATGVGVRILHNLDIFDLSKITKESTKFLLTQVIV